MRDERGEIGELAHDRRGLTTPRYIRTCWNKDDGQVQEGADYPGWIQYRMPSLDPLLIQSDVQRTAQLFRFIQDRVVVVVFASGHGQIGCTGQYDLHESIIACHSPGGLSCETREFGGSERLHFRGASLFVGHFHDIANPRSILKFIARNKEREHGSMSFL